MQKNVHSAFLHSALDMILLSDAFWTLSKRGPSALRAEGPRFDSRAAKLSKRVRRRRGKTVEGTMQKGTMYAFYLFKIFTVNIFFLIK